MELRLPIDVVHFVAFDRGTQAAITKALRSAGFPRS